MNDLDDVLNDEVIESEPVEQQNEQPAAETVQANTDDSIEVTETTGEEVTATPVVETENKEPDQVTGLKAGIAAERQKRQDVEARLEQYEQQIQQARANQEKTDFWDNPEQVLNNYARDMQARMQQMQTSMSVEMMRNAHPDYDQTETAFIERAKANPALITEMNQSGNPAKFAYEHEKTQQQIQEFSNPEEYKAKIRAEVMNEMEAEKKAGIETAIKQQLPGTLSTERAAGGNTVQPIPAYEPLENLVG